MFKIYAVCIPKSFIGSINASPYNLIMNFNGEVYLEETTKEVVDDFVYYLLEDIDYRELSNYQDNIIPVSVNKIIKLDGKILIK